jgi:amino acid transporter
VANQTTKTGLWGIVFYAVAMNFGIRWLATAAAVGPVSLPIWIAAGLLFLAPLSIATLELSARFPHEGAVYAWSAKTLGPMAGFLCGWLYWACNLPFFTGLLVFIINLAARPIGGPFGLWLLTPLGMFCTASLIALIIAALHTRGMGSGQWLPVAGAVASLALWGFLVWCAVSLGFGVGSATDFGQQTYLPKFDANGAILWSTMVFAFGGAEGVALLRNDVTGGVKQIAKALIWVGIFLCAAYMAGTVSMLMIMPADQASRLGGLPEALDLALGALGLSVLSPFVVALLAFALLGQLSAWFGAAARLPFAAGLDRGLPKIFAFRDAKTGAPVTAIWLQTALVILILAISQAGQSLRGAYDFIISMSVISYTLPFVFLFAAFFVAQARPAATLDWQTPGGPKWARFIAIVGLIVALSAIAGSLLPASDSPADLRAVSKLLWATAAMIGAGFCLYCWRFLAKKDPS